jgi:hypothetical protein
MPAKTIQMIHAERARQRTFPPARAAAARLSDREKSDNDGSTRATRRFAV